MADLIQSLWIGPELSKIEQLCIRSFINNGHTFELYTYSDIKNIPDGTVVKDASEIVSQDNVFTYKDGWGKGSYAGFADLFRFELLFQKGGWWVDTDVICLKQFDLESERIICSSYEGEWGDVPNSCILRLPKGDPILRYMLDEVYKMDFKNCSFGNIGPTLIQKTIVNMQLEKIVVPYYYFNPISWSNVGNLILGKTSTLNKTKEFLRPYFKPGTMRGRKISSSSYSVHFWNEVWKQSSYDKNATYSYFSLFEKLKRLNGVQ